MNELHHTSIHSLPLLAKGKVRDTYIINDDLLLMITTDRISAFDVIMNEPIPRKGMVLNQMSNFWFDKLSHVCPNHLTGIDPKSVVQKDEVDQVVGRSVVVKRLKPILVEAVVRGYLIGSGWSDYQKTGQVCGIELPSGLLQAQKFEEPIFTPAAKAEAGEHDENITFAQVVEGIGQELADQIKSVSIALYNSAQVFAFEQGIIIADTKFEFGLDTNGQLVLMDEVLTADSSRFWPLDSYSVGQNPPSFDKQYLRDYLDGLDWNKTAPAPTLPVQIVQATSEKYSEALFRLTGQFVNDGGE